MERQKLPSYVEAFFASRTDRERVRNYMVRLIREGVIPASYNTGFLGITIDVQSKFLEFLDLASDQQMKKAVEIGREEFK